MAFKTSSPFIRDGKTFDLVGVSLITSPAFLENKVEATIILKLDFYRINGAGEIERPMRLVDTPDGQQLVVDSTAVRSIVLTEAYAKALLDMPLAQALTNVGSGIQQFINAKGM